MKKLIKKASVTSLMLFAVAMSNAHAAGPDYTDGICKLVAQMGTLFGTLRTLAFLGAAFIIAGWAWEYISAGKGVDIKGVKDKGIGMLVGFVLLFSIGLLISFLMGGSGPCAEAFMKW